jgi:hypothetical protein
MQSQPPPSRTGEHEDGDRIVVEGSNQHIHHGGYIR